MSGDRGSHFLRGNLFDLTGKVALVTGAFPRVILYKCTVAHSAHTQAEDRASGS